MRASRSAWVALAVLCLCAAGSVPPACSHDIDEPGLCAAHCVLRDLAGYGSALPIEMEGGARLDLARVQARPASTPFPLEVHSAPSAPRAPPLA